MWDIILHKYLMVVPYFAAGVVASLLVTPWVNRLARKFNVIRLPPSEVTKHYPQAARLGYDGKGMAAARRLEKPPIPEWGGVAYIVPFIVISLIALGTSHSINIAAGDLASYVYFFMGIIFLFGVGLADDKWELSGRVQLVAHLLAATLIVLSPSDLASFTNPLNNHLIWLNAQHWHFSLAGLPASVVFPGDLVLFVWVLLLIMPVKALGGTDGLMEGNMFIASVVISLVSIRYQHTSSAVLSAVLAGTLLGFLFYNFYPAKIMSGSSGKSVVGFLLGGFSLFTRTKLAVTILVLLLPILDYIWVMIRRVMIHKTLNPLKLLAISDRLHLHHQLLELGWSEKRIAYTEYLITLIIGGLAFALSGLEKAVFLIGAAILCLGIIIFTTYYGDGKKGN